MNADNTNRRAITSIFWLVLFLLVIIVLSAFFNLLGKKIIKEKVIEKRIDPQESEWITVSTSTPWEARDAQTVITFKNKLYLFGGLNANNVVDPNGTVRYWDAPHLKDLWVTADGVNWTEISTSTLWGESRSMSAVEKDGKMYVMAGWNARQNKYNDKIWTSEDGVNWTENTPEKKFPAREGQVVLIYKSRFFMFGGVNFTTRETYNDVWTSDDGIEWTLLRKDSSWTPRYDHAVAIFQDKIYLTGGLHIGTHKTESEVWVSEDGINWEKRIPEWPSRHGHISLLYKNKLWVIGGWHNDPQNDTGINDTWFTEDGTNWFKINKDGPWFGREDHMGGVFLDRMWLTGGMDTNEHWNSDIYYLNLDESKRENK